MFTSSDRLRLLKADATPGSKKPEAFLLLLPKLA
jgi:hypothetical protein